MKKLLFSLLMLCLFACSCVKKNSSEAAIHKLKFDYQISYPQKMADGSVYYSFTAHENVLKVDAKIKGCFDQGMGLLPQRTKIHKTATILGNLFNLYEYETLNEKVIVENHFLDSSLSDEMYLECKIWVTKK